LGFSNIEIVLLGGGTGSGGAPVDASYVLITNDPTLTNDRALAAGTGIAIVDGGVNGNVTISSTASAGITELTTDVVAGPGSGSQVATIQPGVVSNSKLATVPTKTFKGRTAALTGAPTDLTATEATAMLNGFTTSVKGLVPGPNSTEVTRKNVLNADGTWNTTVGADNLLTTGNSSAWTQTTVSTQSLWSFTNSNLNEGAGLFYSASGAKKFVEFYAAATDCYIFIDATIGAGVIANDWIGVGKLANPSTIGPTLYSSSYPAYYAGTDDKAYFKGGSGIITQLTAPTTTQDEGVNLSTSVKTLNFTGGGVTASGAGETTTVNIPAVVNAATSGTGLLDFGSFPGTKYTSLVITGQAGIVAGSSVEAWITPTATADHTADEHVLEGIKVMAGNIVAGTGFTIYGLDTSEINEPLSIGAKGTLISGKFTVAWRWV